MTIGIIESLQMVDIYDHGKPNAERVAIYVKQACDLSEYCLLLGMPGVESYAAPVRDHFLWFGNGFVNPGDWIMVYTASGTTTITPIPNAPGQSNTNRIINIHWGKEHTVFQNRAVTPVLIKIGALASIAPPAPAYQGPPNKNQPRLF